MMRWVCLLLPAVAVLATLGWLAHRHLTIVESVRAEILTRAPVGSSRDQVDQAVAPLRVDWAQFDYPSGDPRQGTLSTGVMRPALAFRQVHLVLHYDRARPGGKLTALEVSEAPIDVPSP